MKQIPCLAFAGLLCSAALLPSALANHRTGSLVLPELLVAGDFNEDGNLDLAVNATGFDNMAILLGDGTAHFALSGHVASDTLPKGLAVGDVNRDGHLDLVQCNQWGYNAVVHSGDGLGGFGERDLVLNGEGEPHRVILADFNADHILDLAVAGPGEGVILIYLGDKKGGFTLPPKEIEGVPHCEDLIAADFNGDGKLDIATATTPKISVFLGDGTGSFTLSAQLAGSPHAASLAAVDLDKDGKLDLVVAGAGPDVETGNFISTYLGDGAGSFVLKQSNDLGRFYLNGGIAVGDFNEDGNADVALPIDKVLLYFGDGTGNMVAQPSITVGSEPQTIVTADFNKDGHADLAVTNRSDGTVSVLTGNGSGLFTVFSTISILCPTCLEE